MLIGIPKALPPELLKVLCEMGHGDRIVIGDGNFPSESIGKGKPVIRMDGHKADAVLFDILKLIPLDTYTDTPILLMEKVPGDTAETPIIDRYEEIAREHSPKGSRAIGYLERFRFYEKASKAYAIIATGEESLYANAIIQKGVIA